MPSPVLTLTDAGLYCPAGGFHIDPWRGVDRAVVTHAHGDHLRWGSRHYLVTKAGENVSRVRLNLAPVSLGGRGVGGEGDDRSEELGTGIERDQSILNPHSSIPQDRLTPNPSPPEGEGSQANSFTLQALDYGEPIAMNRAKVSFHPAGHVLGSAQVRIEVAGEVWVVSGDYKTGGGDPTCAPFEPVRCHGFVTESTFALPIYRWPASAELCADINAWWRSNAAAGKASIVYAYSLGKAQRVLAGLDASIGPIFTHGAVERLTQAYRETGVNLPPTEYAGLGTEKGRKRQFAGAMVIAPPSADGSPWARKFAPASEGIASGWMAIRGTRRRKSVDRGFVMSDHADWNGLLRAVKETGAERVWVTHGYSAVLVRHLREQGLDAEVLQTRFEGEAGGELDSSSRVA